MEDRENMFGDLMNVFAMLTELEQVQAKIVMLDESFDELDAEIYPLILELASDPKVIKGFEMIISEMPEIFKTQFGVSLPETVNSLIRKTIIKAPLEILDNLSFIGYDVDTLVEIMGILIEKGVNLNLDISDVINMINQLNQNYGIVICVDGTDGVIDVAARGSIEERILEWH